MTARIGHRKRCPPSIHRDDRRGPDGSDLRRRRARPRVERPDLAVEARQHQAPADELDLRDDVGVRHPPGDLAVGLERERLDLGLDDDVGEARRAEHGEDRRGGPVAPAQRPRSRASNPYAWKPYFTTSSPSVSHSIPAGSSLIVEASRTVHGPDRRLDPDLRPAARIRIRPGELAEVRQRPAGLRQREDGRAPGRCPPSGGWRAGRRGTR